MIKGLDKGRKGNLFCCYYSIHCRQVPSSEESGTVETWQQQQQQHQGHRESWGTWPYQGRSVQWQSGYLCLKTIHCSDKLPKLFCFQVCKDFNNARGNIYNLYITCFVFQCLDKGLTDHKDIKNLSSWKTLQWEDLDPRPRRRAPLDESSLWAGRACADGTTQEAGHAHCWCCACAEALSGHHACPPSPFWRQQQQGIESSPCHPARVKNGTDTFNTYFLCRSLKNIWNMFQKVEKWHADVLSINFGTHDQKWEKLKWL